MSVVIDSETRDPRWSTAQAKRAPKEDFALQAAKKLRAGRMTFDELKEKIIEAANAEWKRKGGRSTLGSLKQVERHVSASAKGWFFELQRVFQAPHLIDQLIAQEGRGLTALSRKAGPFQAQRRKGFADAGPDVLIRDLTDVLAIARRKAKLNPNLSDALILQCAEDLKKYRALLKTG